MESRTRLGIYLRKDRATVVCLAPQGPQGRLLGAFSLDLSDAEQVDPQTLADRIAEACDERGFKFAESVVALDCALFMQHKVHSEFADYKKIAATVRFDTEEALATDVSDMAVAFRIVAKDENGASLDVFTAQRSILTDILLSLESNKIDPVAVLPDASCLSRYLAVAEQSQDAPRAYALLSDARGYLIGPPNTEGASFTRAFLVGPAQDRKALLTREALVTAAISGTGDEAARLCVLDSKNGLIAGDLAPRLPFQTEDCDLTAIRGVDRADLADCSNAVDFAIAYGAALPESEKDKGANFRNDHMPYLGKALRLQKSVRFLSISLTVLLLACGVYAQTQLMRVNRYQTTLNEKLEPDYLAVMPGEQRLPDTMREAVRKLGGTLRVIRANKTGIGADQDSILAKMTLVLQAINACAAQTDLKIDTITFSPANIVITGDTSRRPNTLRVFDAMEKAGLVRKKEGYIEKDNRDTFTITVEPRK